MARKRRLLALATGSLTVTVAACSLLDGLDAEYTLKRTTVDSEGGPDGAVDSDATVGKDTGGDVAKADADADADAAVETDAGFCEVHGVGKETDVTFCWDFESATGGGPQWGWTDGRNDNGTTSVESGIGVRGSRALHASISKPPVTGNASISQLMTDPFNSYTKHELSFSYAVIKKSSLYTASIGAIGYGSSLMGISVYKGAPDVVDVSDPPGMSQVADPVSLNAWRRAKIVMNRPDGGTTYATTITISNLDGSSATEVDARTGFAGGSAKTVLYVGAFFTSNDPNGTVETVIDDVLLKQKK